MNESSLCIDDLLLQHHLDNPVIVEAMVEQYYTSLYHLALSILNDPFMANDATQDVFIKASLNLNRYTPGTNFKAWLYAIAVNICRGYLRKQLARKHLDSVLKTIHIVSAPSSNPEQSALDDEQRSQIWKAVYQLSEKHQWVVVLRIKHELSISEIATILGTNEKTVYTRLYAAFRQLRFWLSLTIDSD
jgi:RNA polymerase sigma-70 factor (ECF subfamily)